MLMSCYIAIDDDDGALEAARRTIKRSEAAVAKDPANGAALAAGATALIALGETERGKDWIQRAQMLDPDNLAVLYNLACGLTFKNADIDGALDLLQQWSESAPLAYVRYAEIDPDIDPVRDNPRYTAMIEAAQERLGMTEQS
jgi:adenylate cyclase